MFDIEIFNSTFSKEALYANNMSTTYQQLI